MTTNANAPVETRHIQAAGKVHTAAVRDELAQSLANNEQLRCDLSAYEQRFAQTLANLEAVRAENASLTNRLAEIDRIAVEESWTGRNAPAGQVAHLASGHTPSPCPGCAAKDEAMEAFKADLSDTLIRWYSGRNVPEAFSDFIIPPADPVAETVREIVEGIWQNGTPSRDDLIRHVSAELKSRLLGGAK